MLQRPIKGFFEPFQRICAIEPRIEGAVCKDAVRCSTAARSGPNGQAGKGPNSVHYDAVKPVRIGLEPAPDSRRKPKGSKKRLAESVDRARNALEKGFIRAVKANDLDAIPYFKIRLCKLAKGLRRAASSGRQTTDDVKYMQK